MKTLAELEAYLSKLPSSPAKYNIAVGSLIFTRDDKVILLERGPKARDGVGTLEGVGGSLDGETDLHEALQREIQEELGDVRVQIDKLLNVLVLPNTKGDGLWWVVPQFLCRLLKGTPTNMEPEKCAAIHVLALEDVAEDRLSQFQKVTAKAYAEQYGTRPYYLA
jgi:ADP-ribose pyrophosphatase YjhB (NUDIX family)